MTDPRRTPPRHARDQRGVALPSPVVLLSIVAVAMAAVAYLFTQGSPETEREVAIVSRDQTPSASPSPTEAPTPSKEPSAEPEPEKKTPPPVKRGEVFVTVFNNSGITGLAGQVGGSVTEAGWQVSGTDNWYGSVPATTVYFPPQLERAARQLALDVGVDRVQPAVDGMGGDRLTLILTAPLG
ncbi:LytR C-terminal domain-containing protein [Nocardioides sp. AX2bis]|uniref:LytR C-terminal domain-containing protein n=1 Tax=Nocardioides sp. AX2bis TaxID=2653157 RepID=UPI0012F46B11|nr:LytR C-terminal domain-containing protein [Nocardioides sp. AX2bis]VXA93536.1 conserved hypothetical protein [Nocardioides sp. AX2bis]